MTQSSQKSTSSKAAAGNKHKSDSQSLPKPKRGTASDGTKEQITLEETLENKNGNNEDEEIKKEEDNNGEKGLKKANRGDALKSDEPSKKEASTKERDITPNHADLEERDEEMPSSMIEKGLIYFFIRPRVNITNPHSVEDTARTYIVLRPLPLTAKLTDDSILASDSAENRILALPKKVLPAGGQDRFM